MSPLAFPAVDLKDGVGSLQGYFHGEEAEPAVVMQKRDELSLNRVAAGEEEEEEEASSSIGSASSSFSDSAHGDEEEEEAESKRKDGGLVSLDSLEDAIPVK